MFQDYLYISSASETLKNHLYDLSDIVVERRHLGKEDLVVDVGCNDGTLLTGFKRHGVKTLGIDPAENLEEFTNTKGIMRYTGYFNTKTAQEIVEKWGLASVITSTNSFPHIQDLQDFMKAIKLTLTKGGALVIEMHYLVDLLDQIAFDTVYHEHISYWAMGPMAYLFNKHGMEIVHAERVPLHHGQLRVSVQRKGEGHVQHSVQEILDLERKMGIHEFQSFQKFSNQTMEIKQNLHGSIAQLLKQGKRVVGYGAPAKGNTLLSFLEIGPEMLEYIVDRSPLKQGRYTPGLHIPVVPTEQLLIDQPDYVLLLAWNFVEEVLDQQKDYRSRGGKFIIPVPEVQFV
jgi:hypothetical protein